MRIVDDLNRLDGDAQPAPDVLEPTGHEALMSHPNPDTSPRQQVPQATTGCPFHAVLAGLDIFADHELDL